MPISPSPRARAFSFGCRLADGHPQRCGRDGWEGAGDAQGIRGPQTPGPASPRCHRVMSMASSIFPLLRVRGRAAPAGSESGLAVGPRRKTTRGPRAFVSRADVASHRRTVRYRAFSATSLHPQVSSGRHRPGTARSSRSPKRRQARRSRHPPCRDTRQARTQKSRALCDTGSGFPSIRFNLYPTSTKLAAALPLRPGAAHASSSVSAAALGKRTMKRLPCPGVDVTSIEPPWRTTTAFTNGKPRPTPRLASRCEPST